ncbi:MAG: acetyl/propionyl/methylcrotonyl-CoA carboxylase subunit alpha [Proteobacteria bacterium]|nr:acetyl/propionyl/methylcrotonyl-CoA carboxylase subunit alpha [Pseudomonadota bacterium]
MRAAIPFQKILIANRGEITCRIARTARRLGITTVAVYSAADRDSLHVRSCDEARYIGLPPATESYLRGDAILQAALDSGAQAIHPGYGFLAENAEFAASCVAAGIVFVGPPAAAIRAMGNKSAAKSLMDRAAVPLVPGYHGSQQDDAVLQAAATRIGYPVLIKASAGGGGKGMRVVERAADFGSQLAGCRREAAASFGDDSVLIEKYLASPRHIELQIFADSHGNVVHLFERDCSVQRRHQKVLEEAPAPGMTEERRAAMAAAAIAAARAVNYVGAGTVEFIVESAASDAGFYFMEMNTRLQVEHPVTELVTGTDLVEWQLRVAAGEPLPLTQTAIKLRGHAIEARIYAENPDAGFLPDTGRLQHLQPPVESASVRVETGVTAGDTITPYYDPMIAKLICWGETRELARSRLAAALAQYQIVGVTNNVGFLRRLVETESFRKPTLDTRLIEREAAALKASNRMPATRLWFAAAVAQLLREADQGSLEALRKGEGHSPWWRSDGWRLNGTAGRQLELQLGETTRTVAIEYLPDGWRATLDGQTEILRARVRSASDLWVSVGAESFAATAVFSAPTTLNLFTATEQHRFELGRRSISSDDYTDSGGHLRAPLPGRVIAVLTTVGSSVTKDTPLIVVEAMKMEHTVLAPRDGRIAAIHYEVGDSVQINADLIEFETGK